jgi:uncharacterized cupin superfamily protein
VLDGSPTYRVKLLHTTPDELYPAVLWDCTRGKFRWHFDADELVYVLEGRVIVHDDDGHVTRLGPGDTALFLRGTTNVWEVPYYVKKLAVRRHRRTRVLGGARRAVSGMRALFRTAAAALGGAILSPTHG